MNLPRVRRPTPAWTLLEPRFDGEGRIPLVDEQGNHFFLAHAELREAISEGALVNSVEKEGPAQKAGLLVGDRITKAGLTHLDEGRLL